MHLQNDIAYRGVYNTQDDILASMTVLHVYDVLSLPLRIYRVVKLFMHMYQCVQDQNVRSAFLKSNQLRQL